MLQVAVAKLVEDGYLDLEQVFSEVEWQRKEALAKYTLYAYGPDGEHPGEVTVFLEESDAYGITGYRWVTCDSDYDPVDEGCPFLDREAAAAAGREFAEENDAEEPNTDELLAEIVATGFFGKATAAELLEVCVEATKHAHGCIHLPPGIFCGRPVSRLVIAAECSEIGCVDLPVGHRRASYAAYALADLVKWAVASDQPPAVADNSWMRSPVTE